MSQQAKTGYIGAGRHAHLNHRLRSRAIKGCHPLINLSHCILIRQTPFNRCGDDAGADRLGEDDLIARLGSGVGYHLVRVHDAGHRHPILGLGVIHRVPADDTHTGFSGFVDRTLKDALKHLEG